MRKWIPTLILTDAGVCDLKIATKWEINNRANRKYNRKMALSLFKYKEPHLLDNAIRLLLALELTK